MSVGTLGVGMSSSDEGSLYSSGHPHPVPRGEGKTDRGLSRLGPIPKN